MIKRKRVAKMTELGIMVDTKELYKLGPVNGAISMFADLVIDIISEKEDDSPPEEKTTK